MNDIPTVIINGKHVERLQTFKLLVILVSTNLSWDVHIEYMLKKIVKHMYSLFYMDWYRCL